MSKCRLLAMSPLLPLLCLIPPAPQARAQVVTTRIVLMPVIVTNRTGLAVTGLVRENFRVFDDGAEQTISFFKTVGSDVTSYTGYVIGFTPAKGADGRRHSLVVMIDQANLRVRTRNAYVAASTECKPDTSYPGFSCVY
jgi:hypothetical protein